jgi:transposase
MMEQDRSFKGPDVVRFLRHALREISGKLLVIWDGSAIHRGQAVIRLPRERGRRENRLQLEQLPGYAPDLNPDEGIWKHLKPQKCVELKNVCCQSLSELRSELRKARERLRPKTDVILGCIRQPALTAWLSDFSCTFAAEGGFHKSGYSRWSGCRAHDGKDVRTLRNLGPQPSWRRAEQARRTPPPGD